LRFGAENVEVGLDDDRRDFLLVHCEGIDGEAHCQSFRISAPVEESCWPMVRDELEARAAALH